MKDHLFFFSSRIFCVFSSSRRRRSVCLSQEGLLRDWACAGWGLHWCLRYSVALSCRCGVSVILGEQPFFTPVIEGEDVTFRTYLCNFGWADLQTLRLNVSAEAFAQSAPACSLLSQQDDRLEDRSLHPRGGGAPQAEPGSAGSSQTSLDFKPRLIFHSTIERLKLIVSCSEHCYLNSVQETR